MSWRIPPDASPNPPIPNPHQATRLMPATAQTPARPSTSPYPPQRVVSARSWPERVRNFAQTQPQTIKHLNSQIEGRKLAVTPEQALPTPRPRRHQPSAKPLTRSGHELADTTRCISQPANTQPPPGNPADTGNNPNTGTTINLPLPVAECGVREMGGAGS